MPMVGVVSLDFIRRNSLWEGQHDKRKMHLMKWSEVIKPRMVVVGLGLGNLESNNWELLTKWWWRQGQNQEIYLWRGI